MYFERWSASLVNTFFPRAIGKLTIVNPLPAIHSLFFLFVGAMKTIKSRRKISLKGEII